jgi:hypothetical protein
MLKTTNLIKYLTGVWDYVIGKARDHFADSGSNFGYPFHRISLFGVGKID